jgi:hypothetical protein
MDRSAVIQGLMDYQEAQKEKAERAKQEQKKAEARKLRQATFDALVDWDKKNIDAHATTTVAALLSPDDPGIGSILLERGVELRVRHDWKFYARAVCDGRVPYEPSSLNPLLLLATIYDWLAKMEKETREKQERAREINKGAVRNSQSLGWLDQSWAESKRLFDGHPPDEWTELYQASKVRLEQEAEERRAQKEAEEARREAECRRIEAENKEAARKKDLRTRALFYPFRVWKIEHNPVYGGEEGEWACDEFYALNQPDKDGWCEDIYGKRIRVYNVARVVEVTVEKLDKYEPFVTHPKYGNVWMPPMGAQLRRLSRPEVCVQMDLETCQPQGDPARADYQGGSANSDIHRKNYDWRWVPAVWFETEEGEDG